MSRRPRRLVGALTLPILLAGCGLFGGGSSDLELVAGGGDDPQGTTGEDVRLGGVAVDLAVADGMVYLLASTGGDRRLVTVAPDGSVTHQPLDFPAAQYVAAGPAGEVYAASKNEIRRLDTDPDEALIVSVDSGAAENSDALVTDGSIQGLAVDADGHPIWTESFLGAGPDGAEPPLVRINRLVGGEVEHVAGASETAVDGHELVGLRTTPPEGVTAVDLPLRAIGRGGALAAGEAGIFIGSSDGILRIGDDGSVASVVGPADREAPDAPFDDERDAREFGGGWEAGGDLDTSGEVLVGVQSTFSSQIVDVGAFDWSGDFTDGAEDVAAKIVRGPRADGSFDLDADRSPYGDVAVVIHDGRAATAMAHVTRVAIDDGRLYAVGQTRGYGDSDADDAEMLIVAMELPDDWR
ncbi:hypothetical protein [Phytoactinopolyspora limicola]|uniref:hypothetical protein n=1 Tax=Phytoactinopolyspora limicola TaxID=2715536 RepID=UPI00140CA2DF|nr:hypothetical protein [Phytoactinopolyspora limicola]